MTEGKLRMLVVGLFGFGIWGVCGFVIAGWNGAVSTLVAIGLISSVAHTFGSVFRYFSFPDSLSGAGDPLVAVGTYFNMPAVPISISPEVGAALDAFRKDTHLHPFGPPSEEEAKLRIVRDWLIGHGYLDEIYADAAVS